MASVILCGTPAVVCDENAPTSVSSISVGPTTLTGAITLTATGDAVLSVAGPQTININSSAPTSSIVASVSAPSDQNPLPAGAITTPNINLVEGGLYLLSVQCSLGADAVDGTIVGALDRIEAFLNTGFPQCNVQITLVPLDNPPAVGAAGITYGGSAITPVPILANTATASISVEYVNASTTFSAPVANDLSAVLVRIL